MRRYCFAARSNQPTVALKGADGGDLRSFQALGARELRQRGDRLIARVAHHHVGDDVRVLDKDLHEASPGA